MGVDRLGKALKFILLLLVTTSTAAAEVSYSFQIAENGETTVEIQLTESASIKLPADVTQPDIEGGSTKALDNNVTYVNTNGTAKVAYTSAYYTRKEQGVWHFETMIPNADSIKLTLPQAVHVVQSQPSAAFTKTDQWHLSWENLTGSITVSYVSVNQPKTSPSITLPRASNITIVYILAVLIILGLANYFYRRRKESTFGRPNITEGQLNILRAANPNEALVLKTMLKYNGHIKRNQLEKESKLSKSSLASVLKILERKNIVSIDRTFNVHYITFTKWFSDLK